jgi:hypothetical protein
LTLQPEHCAALAVDGLVVVVDAALSTAELGSLRSELEGMAAAGTLVDQAQVPGGGQAATTTTVAWVGGAVTPPGPAVLRAVGLLKGLAYEVNSWAAAALAGGEVDPTQVEGVGGGRLVVPEDSMVACYAGDGRGYVRHLDNTCSGPDGLSVRVLLLPLHHLRFHSTPDAEILASLGNNTVSYLSKSRLIGSNQIK